MEAIVLLIVGLGVYFLPSLVASSRNCNPSGVFMVNLFFGWTFLGWFVAFVMACGKPDGN